MWMEYPKKLFCSNADAGVPVGVPPSRSLPCQRSNSLRDFKLAIFTVTAIHRGGGNHVGHTYTQSSTFRTFAAQLTSGLPNFFSR